MTRVLSARATYKAEAEATISIIDYHNYMIDYCNDQCITITQAMKLKQKDTFDLTDILIGSALVHHSKGIDDIRHGIKLIKKVLTRISDLIGKYSHKNSMLAICVLR